MSDQAKVHHDSGDSTVAPFPRSHAERADCICDRDFMNDVERLKALRSYMIQQARGAEAGSIELGQLNVLRYTEDGRFPTVYEWQYLEHESNKLYQYLPETDRRRFLYGQIPFVVVRTASALGFIALASLVVAVALPLFEKAIGESAAKLGVFIAFLMWAAALGAIGSIAFIGMNALAVQEDATFDILNKKLIGLRVVLGALFAGVLTLSFGFDPFL